MAETTHKKSIEQRLEEFESKFSPLNFYYRLRDLGFEKEEALKIQEDYNKIYSSVIEEVKEQIGKNNSCFEKHKVNEGYCE